MPFTPGHSRHSSNIETYQMSSRGSSPIHRRQSKSSFQGESMTPLRHTASNEGDMSGMGGDNGLGNLADELADALSGSDEDGEYYENGDHPPDISLELPEGDGAEGLDGGLRDSGVGMVTQMDHGKVAHRSKGSLGLPPQNGRGHRRKGSEYDGSEYGSESDLEPSGMPPSLVARMDAVESLARRGTESGPADMVFKRVTEGLRDLGSQSNVEGSTTRLITAHSALATHVAHQTRQLHNLTFPLLSPLVAPPDPETIDDLLPVLVSLSENMPRPATSAYNSLAALHSVTSDLVQTLNYLSDTLHMSRQTTTTAARRLRSAKEMVAEMKREEELRDEGEEWITRGNWGERLEKRECAGVCKDVVGGFEEVCDGWRARLLAQAESSA